MSPEAEQIYKALLKTGNQDYFKQLGLGQGAPASEVERAFQLLVKQFHLSQMENHFKDEVLDAARHLLQKLSTAHTVLTNPKRREEYLKVPQNGPPPNPDPMLMAESNFNQAQLFIKYGNLKDALTSVDEALKLNAKEPDYLLCKGDIMMRQSLKAEEPVNPEVEKLLRRALELRDNYFRANFALGNYFKNKQDFAQALRHYQRSCEAKPDFAEAAREVRLLTMRQDKNQGLLARLKKKG